MGLEVPITTAAGAPRPCLPPEGISLTMTQDSVRLCGDMARAPHLLSQGSDWEVEWPDTAAAAKRTLLRYEGDELWAPQ